MNLFDQLVIEAIKNQPGLSTLRMVVEKELLHHDILRILSQHHFLNELVFIGGTCLRACYSGIRLSEDLDFTGGKEFTRTSLVKMGQVLANSVMEKYGFEVHVSEPVKEIKNTDTWKIKIETRPQEKHMPSQRINIDICRVPSYEKKPMLLINPYQVDMGTNGLIIQAQSREEIYADKLLAFALRPNRIKHRDLWDILWLHQHSIKPRLSLISQKLHDRQLATDYFFKQFDQRQKLLTDDRNLPTEFKKEMQRFLPAELVNNIISQENLWSFIIYLINDFREQLNRIV